MEKVKKIISVIVCKIIPGFFLFIIGFLLCAYLFDKASPDKSNWGAFSTWVSAFFSGFTGIFTFVSILLSRLALDKGEDQFKKNHTNQSIGIIIPIISKYSSIINEEFSCPISSPINTDKLYDIIKLSLKNFKECEDIINVCCQDNQELKSLSMNIFVKFLSSKFKNEIKTKEYSDIYLNDEISNYFEGIKKRDDFQDLFEQYEDIENKINLYC